MYTTVYSLKHFYFNIFVVSDQNKKLLGKIATFVDSECSWGTPRSCLRFLVVITPVNNKLSLTD